jgi:hypothetical protein
MLYPICKLLYFSNINNHHQILVPDKKFTDQYFLYIFLPSPKFGRGVGGEGIKYWYLSNIPIAPLTPQSWGEQDRKDQSFHTKKLVKI